MMDNPCKTAKMSFFAFSFETVRITGFHPGVIILRELSQITNCPNLVTLPTVRFELWAKNAFYRKLMIITPNLWGFLRQVKSELVGLWMLYKIDLKGGCPG